MSPDVTIEGTEYYGGVIKNLETPEELSATGLGEMKGAFVTKAPDMWLFSVVDLLVGDVVLKLDDEEINDIDDFISKLDEGSTYDTMYVWRYQEMVKVALPDLSDCSIPVLLNSNYWKLVSSDSEAPSYAATNAFDNNASTYWNTIFEPSEEPYPHEFVVDMRTPYHLDYFEYTGRASSGGRVKEFELYVSSDQDNWGEPVLEWILMDEAKVQRIKIEKENDGQYFKFVALSAYSGEAATVAEIDVQGACGTNFPASPYLRFEAEMNDAESGTVASTTSDIDGDQELGDFEDGDYIMFSNLNMAGADSIDVRIASAADNGIIEVRLGAVNGKIISFIDVPNTGSTTDWKTVGSMIDKQEGQYDVYFVFRGEGNDLFKLNWLQLRKYTSPFPLLEAEDYNSSFGSLMAGATTDDKFEDEEGQILKFLKPGNWVQFSDIDLSGVSSVNARYGTTVDDAFIEVRLDAADGERIGTINLSSTGSWNFWETASGNISDVNGIHDVYFVFQAKTSSVVCNSNWFQFSGASVLEHIDPGLRIEAEDYFRAKGTSTILTSDVDGESELASIQNGDWILFKNINLTDLKSLDVRVASPNDGGRIEARLDAYDGPIFSYIALPNTGGSTDWTTFNAKLFSIADGVHDVYLVFKGASTDLVNINWIHFKDISAGISKNKVGQDIQIFPNPAGDYLTINGNTNSKLAIFNALGQKVLEDVLKSDHYTFSLKDLDKGIYSIRVQNGDGITTTKLIKQ